VKAFSILCLPAFGAGLVFLVTGSITTAMCGLVIGVLIAVTPALKSAVSTAARTLGNTSFVLGAMFVVFLMRKMAPHKDQGAWRGSPVREVSSSAYSKIPRTRSWQSVVRSTAVLVFLVALLDTAVGSTLTDPPLVDPSERLERVPSVLPGDIEYQVQRDGEQLYLTPTPGARWHLNNMRSATINWNTDDGRKTYLSSSVTSESQRVAVIGGSAAFGFGQSDDMTIASELAEALSTAGTDVHVSNFGMPGYTTVQAVRDLEDRIQNGLRVDVVVAYTGVNELFLGFGGRRVPRTLLEGAAKVPDGPITWWLNNSAISRIAGRDPVFRKPLMRLAPQGSNSDGSWRMANQPVDKSVRDSIYNLEEGYEALQELAKKHQLRVVFVYQPTWFEARLDPVDRKTLDLDEFARELLGSAWGEVRYLFLKAHEDVIDARGFVDSKVCWIDASHTRGKCSADIARQIVSDPNWSRALSGAAK
jgi:hypothetical protein